MHGSSMDCATRMPSTRVGRLPGVGPPPHDAHAARADPKLQHEHRTHTESIAPTP